MTTAFEVLKWNMKNKMNSERTEKEGDSRPAIPGDSHPDNREIPQDGQKTPSSYPIGYGNGWKTRRGSWLIGSWTDFWL